MSAYDPIIYGCPCGTGFRVYEDLLHHRRTSNHTGPSRCLICGLQFARAFNLKSHQLSHKPPSIRCPWCPTRVKRMTDLTRHRVSCHAGESGRVYKCPWCDSAFTRTDGRQRHLRSCVTRRRLVGEGKEEWVKKREEEVKKGREWGEGTEMEARDLVGRGLDGRKARSDGGGSVPVTPVQANGEAKALPLGNGAPDVTMRDVGVDERRDGEDDERDDYYGDDPEDDDEELAMHDAYYDDDDDDDDDDDPDPDAEDPDDEELPPEMHVLEAPRWGVYAVVDTEYVTEKSREDAESREGSGYDTGPPTRASSEADVPGAAPRLEVRERAGWLSINRKR